MKKRLGKKTFQQKRKNSNTNNQSTAYLITEDFDLAGGSVDEAVGAGAEVVSVDLQVQRETLHTLLRGEVCAEGVNANINLHERKHTDVSCNTLF